MNIEQPTNGRNSSDNLSCPHCHTQLPPQAVFCSSCGKRREKYPFSQHVRQLVTKPVSTLSPFFQRNVASNPPGSDWLWPTIIVLSAVAAALVNFVFTDTAIRPIIVFWFLFVCPGMALVRLLRLKEPVVEWTLAVALSFAIEAIVASIQLYTGRWSPTSTLAILIGLSLSGAFVQFVTMHSALTLVPKQLPTVLSVQRRLLVTLSLLLLIVISLGSIGTGLWFYIVYQNSRSSSSTVISPSKVTPHSNPPSTGTSVPFPSPAAFINISGSYDGTLHDIPTGTTANISFSNIQQQQGNIAGYFGGMSGNALFNEIPQNGPFTGTVNTARQIQFTLTNDTGQAMFAFDGLIQPDGNIAGTYCSLGTATGKCSDYGLWSVSPGTLRTR